MKIKRSIAIPPPLNERLTKLAKREEMSFCALVTHLLLNATEKEIPNVEND